MQTIYIIPGFKHSGTEEAYRQLSVKLKHLGLNPVLQNVLWRRSTMSEWVSDFSSSYNKNKNSENSIILGFSFGALIALTAYPLLKIKPKHLILCSLVPWFKEDLNALTKTDIKMIGKARYQDFQKFSFSSICSKVDTNVNLLYGSIEAKRYPSIQTRIEAIHAIMRNSRVYRLNRVDHDIGDSKYQSAIISLIK